MNEQILREAWDRNFESSPAMEKARLAALTAQMQRDAQYRLAQRQAAFNPQRQANNFRTNFINQGQSKDEIALAALERFHDEEVSDYTRRRNEEQAAAFHSPNGFPYVARAEPDYANEFPWVKAGRAFASAPIEPSAVVDLERRRSLGSGDPFTAEEEIAAADQFRYRTPSWAIRDVVAKNDAKKQAMVEQQVGEEKYRRQQASAPARSRPSAQSAFGEDGELRSMMGAQSGQNRFGLGAGVTLREGWDSDGELAELDSMMEFDEFAPAPALRPVGSRQITPLGAGNSSPVRASVMPVAPWRIPNYPSW